MAEQPKRKFMVFRLFILTDVDYLHCTLITVLYMYLRFYFTM